MMALVGQLDPKGLRVIQVLLAPQDPKVIRVPLALQAQIQLWLDPKGLRVIRVIRAQRAQQA